MKTGIRDQFSCCSDDRRVGWEGGMDGATVEGFGGAGRDRTGDLLVANEALSQLSYSPTDISILAAENNS
jgi:hypothetical protein